MEKLKHLQMELNWHISSKEGRSKNMKRSTGFRCLAVARSPDLQEIKGQFCCRAHFTRTMRGLHKKCFPPYLLPLECTLALPQTICTRTCQTSTRTGTLALFSLAPVEPACNLSQCTARQSFIQSQRHRPVASNRPLDHLILLYQNSESRERPIYIYDTLAKCTHQQHTHTTNFLFCLI